MPCDGKRLQNYINFGVTAIQENTNAPECVGFRGTLVTSVRDPACLSLTAMAWDLVQVCCIGLQQIYGPNPGRHVRSHGLDVKNSVATLRHVIHQYVCPGAETQAGVAALRHL